MLVQVRVEPNSEFWKAFLYLISPHKNILVKKSSIWNLHFKEFEKIGFISFTPLQIFFNFLNQNAYEDIILILVPQHPENKYCCGDRKRYFLFWEKML